MEDGDKKVKMGDDKKLTEMTIDEYLEITSKRAALSQEECEKQIKNLATLVSFVQSNDEESQLQASYIIGNILTMNRLFRLDIPWQKLTEYTFLFQLVLNMHQKALPQLQYESVVVISMLAEESINIIALVSSGVIPALMKLLYSPIKIARALAVMALGNIAKEDKFFCELIIQNDALEPLMPGFSTELNHENASQILRQFCNFKPKLKAETVKKVLVVLEKNLNSSNEDILVDTCWTLASLSDVDESRNEVATNLRVFQKLFQLLELESPLTVQPLLETVTNILTRCQMEIKVIQELLDEGLLRRLLSILLSKYDNNTNKNICKIITVITKISSNHTHEVVCYGILYVLADLFKSSDYDFKMEVVNVILSVTLIGTIEIMRIVGVICIKALCDMLGSGSSELYASKFTEMCLRGIQCLIKACKPDKRVMFLKNVSVEKIVNLQDDKDVNISQLAKGITEEFVKLNLTHQESKYMFREPGGSARVELVGYRAGG